MNPFFFGDSAAPLYGVYHKAEVQNPTNHSVLLLPPFGQEYMRSHRAVRQLAMMLSRKGIPVLRFDYHGTGDSAHDLHEVTPQQWIANANTAIDELRETSKTEAVSLVALRLSGLIAWEAAKSRNDIPSILLWDSMVSGQHYLDELKAEIKDKPNLARSNFVAEDGVLNYNGFALSAEFQQQLINIDLSTDKPPSSYDVLHLVSMENDQSARLRDQWTGSEYYQYEHIDAPGDWNYVDENGGILLPQQIIQHIVSHYLDGVKAA